MHLEDEGEATSLQAFDDPDFPQRFGEVQWLCLDARRELFQLGVVAGRGQARVPHVVIEVEVRVVNPDGALLERDADEALAVARYAVKVRGDVLLEALAVDGTPRRRNNDPASNSAVEPTCIGVVGLSQTRKKLSSADSRS